MSLGSIFKSDQFHIEREQILTRLVEETDLQIWSSVNPQLPIGRQDIGSGDGSAGNGNSMRTSSGSATARRSPLSFVTGATRRAARFIRGVARAGTDSLSSLAEVDSRITMRARPPLFGLEMFQHLHDSRVALNTHIDISPMSASNMRLFEATGVGTCLLTDWKANLPEIFEPDTEVVAYRDAAECVEKVKYLLGHRAECRRIADAGQRRTLRDHNFDARAAQIDAIIREALSSS
jgi:spore maturation protein CgeB